MRLKPRKVLIGGRPDPFMVRWELFRVASLPRVYLHKFVRSDYDRALHNHPWWYVSILFRGQYIEHTEGSVVHRRAPSIVFRPLTHAHRIELIKECLNQTVSESAHWTQLVSLREQPCWTLFLTGPDVRRWGFFCPSGFVDSVDFQGCEDDDGTLARA